MKIIDLESFNEEMDNDRDVVKMVISELINAIDNQIPRMRALIEERKYLVLGREAHSIKGGARNVMAERLEYASADLEKCVLNEVPEEILASLELFTSEFNLFKVYTTRELSTN